MARKKAKARQGEKRVRARRLSYVFLASAVIYLLTALVMDSNSGFSKTSTLPGSGGIVGPFTTSRDGAVVEVDVHQNVNRNRVWSFITGELLDAKQQYLTGFGDELYYEEGYDSDGHWSEAQRSYDNKLTIPRQGRYFLKFNVESNLDTHYLPSIDVSVAQKSGSSVPFFAGGVLLLIAGVFFNIRNGGILTRLLDS